MIKNIRGRLMMRRLWAILAMGVMILRLDAGEHVTSIFPVLDETNGDGGAAPEEGTEPDAAKDV